MSAVADLLPLTETFEPADQAALAAQVAEAQRSGTAVYPIGGATSLDYGLTPTTPGIGLSLTKLDRVIDYPARDMTITVEAGITMEALASALSKERQWLPIDAPQPASATLGGVIVTAFSGARRYGYGTLRDYVIGISAVDGRGTPFKAGGRVVKNVAGYDFCKLLTGSLGTLGVITQVTLKIKPLPESSQLLVCDVPDGASAERALAALINSGTTPSAVELLSGPYWQDIAAFGPAANGSNSRLAVGLEGTAEEVRWMLAQLGREWQELGLAECRTIASEQAVEAWKELREFPAVAGAPLVLKASVLPSRTVEYVELIRKLDPQASIQAHAGNGIIIARFAKFDSGDLSRVLIGRLQPAAQLAGGHAVVLSSSLPGLTPQAVWGGASEATAWMNQVKAKFDPSGVLNPGRFVYANR